MEKGLDEHYRHVVLHVLHVELTWGFSVDQARGLDYSKSWTVWQ